MKQDFYQKVYNLVKKIPRGKVSTYGHIGRALTGGNSARLVGMALNNCPDPQTPCHRVVNRNGELTGAPHFDHPDMMRDLLENEKVTFKDGRVDMKKHLWVPQSQVNY